MLGRKWLLEMSLGEKENESILEGNGKSVFSIPVQSWEQSRAGRPVQSRAVGAGFTACASLFIAVKAHKNRAAFQFCD